MPNNKTSTGDNSGTVGKDDEDTNIDYANRITVTVTVSDKAEKSITDITDENGKMVVPPTNFDYTDTNGYAEVDGLIVTVKNETAPIEKAYVKHNAEIKNEDGTVKTAENISVELPENIKFNYANRITVKVAKKADSTAVKDITVIVSEKAVEGVETKSLTGITDKDGKTDISETTPGKDTDGDGKTDTEETKTEYNITVEDTKGNAKADVAIILKDRKNNSATGATDKNGMLILPAETYTAYIFGYDDGTFRPDNNMSRAEAAAIFARLISEKKGENISGKATFKDISSKDWFAKEVGYLEKYGIIKGYWAYNDIAYAKNVGWLNGYADGTFKGDNAITRAEVVTVVNRAINRKADEDYITKNVSVLNKFTDIRNNSLRYYFDITEASNTHLANTANNAETWVK